MARRVCPAPRQVGVAAINERALRLGRHLGVKSHPAETRLNLPTFWHDRVLSGCLGCTRLDLVHLLSLLFSPNSSLSLYQVFRRLCDTNAIYLPGASFSFNAVPLSQPVSSFPLFVTSQPLHRRTLHTPPLTRRRDHSFPTVARARWPRRFMKSRVREWNVLTRR